MCCLCFGSCCFATSPLILSAMEGRARSRSPPPQTLPPAGPGVHGRSRTPGVELRPIRLEDASQVSPITPVCRDEIHHVNDVTDTHMDSIHDILIGLSCRGMFTDEAGRKLKWNTFYVDVSANGFKVEIEYQDRRSTVQVVGHQPRR